MAGDRHGGEEVRGAWAGYSRRKAAVSVLFLLGGAFRCDLGFSVHGRGV